MHRAAGAEWCKGCAVVTVPGVCEGTSPILIGSSCRRKSSRGCLPAWACSPHARLTGGTSHSKGQSIKSRKIARSRGASRLVEAELERIALFRALLRADGRPVHVHQHKGACASHSLCKQDTLMHAKFRGQPALGTSQHPSGMQQTPVRALAQPKGAASTAECTARVQILTKLSRGDALLACEGRLR